MENLYFGSSTTAGSSMSIGNTILSTKSLITIEEGYSYGATTEYITLGEYEVSEISNNETNKTLRLSCKDNISKLSNNDIFRSIKKRGSQIYSDNFTDNSISNFSQFTEDSWVVDGGVLRKSVSGTTASETIFLQNLSDIRNGHILSQNSCSGLSSMEFNMGTLVRVNNLGNSDFSGYMTTCNANSVAIYRVDGGNYTLGASVTASFTEGNSYYFLTKFNSNNISVYSSINKWAFKKHLEYNDNLYPNGFVGFRSCVTDGSSYTYLIDELEVIDYGHLLSEERLLRDIYTISSDSGLEIPAELSSLADFQQVSGATWYFGTTNGYEQTSISNTVSGGSWNYLYSLGTTFADFTFDCEVYVPSGVSGNRLGLWVGTTLEHFYMWYLNNTGDSDFNTIWKQYGTTFYKYEAKGDHLRMKEDSWTKISLMKSNQNLFFYISDYYANYIEGVSLNFGGGSVYLGLATWGFGSTETTTFIKNPRISILDNDIQSYNFPLNTNLSSQFSKLLGDNTFRSRGNSVKIFKFGSSMGSIQGLTFFSNINETYDNNAGVNLVRATKGFVTNMEEANISGKRFKALANSTRVSLISNPNINNYSDANKKVENALSRESFNINKVGTNIKNFNGVEVGDQFSFIDNSLGVSRIVYIRSFNKSINFSSGVATTNLEITEDYE